MYRKYLAGVGGGEQWPSTWSCLPQKQNSLNIVLGLKSCQTRVTAFYQNSVGLGCSVVGSVAVELTPSPKHCLGGNSDP